MPDPVTVREMPPGDDRIQIRIAGVREFASIYVSPSTALRLLAALEGFFSDPPRDPPKESPDAA
jgi:hypothetical protein